MALKPLAPRARFILALLALLIAGPSAALAQNTAGVKVDADGVLRKQTFPDLTGKLAESWRSQAKASLDPQIASASRLRKVSLNRLEAALDSLLDKSQGPTDEMRYLAGLTRIEYVFFYPITGDIVIAGPAEGWGPDASGRVVGIYNGKPVLELQDLITALRAYRPGGADRPVIGCSIDPTAEGLAAMNSYMRTVRVNATRGSSAIVAEGLRSAMGLQDVTFHGVPANTHFALVMLEADYRMKLIGLGLERPPVRLTSYVSRSSSSSVAGNALQRWYFVPDYNCVRVSDDGLAMQLVGEGVKLVGETEVVGADGQRGATSSGDRASQVFVHEFTKMYPQLAARSPVYAQLRNLIDLAVAAAYIQQEDFYGAAGWAAETFMSEDRVPVETYETPRNVETVVTAIVKPNELRWPMGGGVQVEATGALVPDRMLGDENGKLQDTRDGLDLQKLAEGQWWWD